MKAVYIEHHGGAGAMLVGERPVPEPGEGAHTDPDAAAGRSSAGPPRRLGLGLRAASAAAGRPRPLCRPAGGHGHRRKHRQGQGRRRRLRDRAGGADPLRDDRLRRLHRERERDECPRHLPGRDGGPGRGAVGRRADGDPHAPRDGGMHHARRGDGAVDDEPADLRVLLRLRRRQDAAERRRRRHAGADRLDGRPRKFGGRVRRRRRPHAPRPAARGRHRDQRLHARRDRARRSACVRDRDRTPRRRTGL